WPRHCVGQAIACRNDCAVAAACGAMAARNSVPYVVAVARFQWTGHIAMRPYRCLEEEVGQAIACREDRALAAVLCRAGYCLPKQSRRGCDIRGDGGTQ